MPSLKLGDHLKSAIKSYILDTFYPIGSVYLTIGDTNPGTQFGGTWQKITGGYLYACVSSIDNSSGTGTGAKAATGNTGSHTLTINEMPSHSHDMDEVSYGGGGYRNQLGIRQDGGGGGHKCPQYAQTNTYSTYLPQATGGGQGHTHTLNSHTHTVEHRGVWVWKRTA